MIVVYLLPSLLAGTYSFCQPVQCLLQYLFLLWCEEVAVDLRVGLELDHLSGGCLLEVLGSEDGLNFIREGHVVNV